AGGGQSRSDSSGWDATVHAARLQGRGRDYRQMGKTFWHPDFYLGHESSRGDEGARNQEIRRHRLLLRRYHYRRALLHRRGIRRPGTGKASRSLGGSRPAVIERYLLPSAEFVFAPSRCRRDLFSGWEVAYSRYHRTVEAGSWC